MWLIKDALIGKWRWPPVPQGPQAAPRILRPAENLKGNVTAEDRPVENGVSPEQIKEKADHSG